MDINYKNKWLIFVGAGKWQQKAILEAKLIGFKILGIDYNPNAEGLRFSDLKIIKKNHTEILKEIKKKDKNYVGVISYCNDAGMVLAGKIRKKFNLTGPSEKISKIMTNKILQRKIWNKYKVPCPKWVSFNEREVYSKIKKIKFNLPIIVKPSDSAGSRGVIVYDYETYGSKVGKLNKLFDVFKESLKFSKEKKIIVEEYFRGTEYTVESFSNNKKNYILAITKKGKVPFTNNTVANSLETIDKNTNLFKILKNLTIKSLKAINYLEGPAHTEILYNEKKNKKILVETAGRGGGFHIYDGLVKFASNEAILKKTLIHSTGKSVSFNLNNRNHVVLKYFASRKGIVKKIIGFNLLKKHVSGDVNIIGASFVKKNEKVKKSTTDADRLGYLLAWGKNKKKTKKIIDKFYKKIKFTIN